MVPRFALRTIARVPGQVIALNSATAHTRKRQPVQKLLKIVHIALLNL